MVTRDQRSKISDQNSALTPDLDLLTSNFKACTSASGHPMRAGSASSATSTTGTGGAIRCGCGDVAGIWEIFLPGLGPRATATNTRSSTSTARCCRSRPTLTRSCAERSPGTASRRLPRRRAMSGAIAPGSTSAGGPTNAGRADLDLRGPSRLVAARPGGGGPLSDLPRAGRAAGRLCQGDGLHPSSSSCRSWNIRSTARGATRRRLLRADQPLRHAAGLHVPCRLPAPARHRRDPRLGAVALPHRRARPGLLRRHAPLRARRPAPGLPPGLEQLIFNYGRNEVANFL